MMGFSKFALLCIFFTVLSGAVAYGQGTYTAASCNQSDVKAVINGPTHTAVNGDVIYIPAGSCTWSSGVSFSVAIQIIGAGAANTIITDANNDGGTYIFSASNIQVTPYLLRYSGMTIQPASGVNNGSSPLGVGGVCNSSTCPNLRVDHMTFTGWNEATNGDQSAWMVREDNVYGVMDHNTVNITSAVLASTSFSSYMGVGTLGDNSWAQPDSFGTAAAMYFENNTFNGANGAGVEDTDAPGPSQSSGGSRFVVRFNTFNAGGYNGLAYTHGTETGNRVRGGRQVEVYGNTATCNGSCSSGAYIRSGVLRQFGNTFASASGGVWGSYVALATYRTYSGHVPWGYCQGLGPYDDNDGTLYASGTITGVSTTGGPLVVSDSTRTWTANQWAVNGNPYSIVDVSITTSGWHPGYTISSSTSTSVTAGNYGQDILDGPPKFNVGDTYNILRASVCIDQPSRGAGTLISGNTPSPTGWVGEVLDPSYEWLDKTTAGSTVYTQSVSTIDQGLVAAKLIANRDFYNYVSSGFNGTSGVGSGTLASRPSTCTTGVGYWATDQGNWNQTGNGFGQGELFVCTATNTWSLNYTPYAYPHPLDRPDPPTGLLATPH